MTATWGTARTVADLGARMADWLEGRIPQSQPGTDMRGNGLHERQRAAVDGYIADTRLLNRITAAARRAGITVVTQRPGSRPRPSIPGIPASEIDGERLQLDWPGISGSALRELRTATHLTIVDPEWGRDSVLWPLLADAIAK